MVRDNFFSKRKTRKKSALLYDVIPSTTRNSIIMIMSEYPDRWETTETGFNYQISPLKLLEREILKNEGWTSLKAYNEQNRFVAVSIEEFLRRCRYDHFLDAVEFFVDILYEEEIPSFVEEINTCFRRDNVGYQLLPHGKIVKFTSNYLHQEVVKEAFSLLNVYKFEGALEEFEKALRYYREGNIADAIHNANNAFESTMKAILNKETGKTKILIDGLIKRNIIYPYTKELMDSVIKILNSFPTLRHNVGGHGQGKSKKKVPESYAEFTLNLSATIIVFLIKRWEEITKEQSKDIDETFPF